MERKGIIFAGGSATRLHTITLGGSKQLLAVAEAVHTTMGSGHLMDRDALGRPISPAGLPFAGSGSPEVPLQLVDEVLIFRRADFELQCSVDIFRDVEFRGKYALEFRGKYAPRPKSDRLATFIEGTGGLTQRPYPGGIRFVRSFAGVRGINIDVPRALRHATFTHKVILQRGDSIQIPEYEPSVQATGAVNSPGSVL